jgi:hypothetical protein
MTRVRSAEAKSIAVPPKAATNPGVVADMKARQLAKIQELGQALIDAGFRTLDEQADALGLARSTAWTILKARHKSSGLSAMIIERMLGSSRLPPRARSAIVEYVEEKAFGLYGGSRRQQQRFAVRLFNIINQSSIFQKAQKASVETARRPGRAPAPAARAAEPGLRYNYPGADNHADGPEHNRHALLSGCEVTDRCSPAHARAANGIVEAANSVSSHGAQGSQRQWPSRERS